MSAMQVGLLNNNDTKAIKKLGAAKALPNGFRKCIPHSTTHFALLSLIFFLFPELTQTMELFW